MKNYQALILGCVISTGSFVLGMNSVEVIRIQETPIRVTDPRQYKPAEGVSSDWTPSIEYLRAIEDADKDFNAAVERYREEENQLRGVISDTGLTGLIEINKSLLSHKVDMVRFTCRSFDDFDGEHSDAIVYRARAICSKAGVHL